MRYSTTLAAASLAAVASAGKDERTFAVLRFDGDGFLTEGRVDPIVNPGGTAAHYHGVMGGSNFGKTVNKDQLLDSKCTTAKIAKDFSNYWVPWLYFQDPKNGTLTKVPFYYMNVYYFFEPSNDEVVAFPPGLKMLSGDAYTREAPASGELNLFDNDKPIQPIQWSCPRNSYDIPAYPVNSNGKMAGMADPSNKQAGAGFPTVKCDGFSSPLRQDIHFPSCYNPKVGLDDYKNNMAWPKEENWKQNCPEGYIHVPHIFFEVYWNTPAFDGLWEEDGKNQPFVLSNGDATGYSSHGDFIAGWDENTLQTIIDTCNAGDIGMDKCPNIPGGLNTNSDCKIDPPVPIESDGVNTKNRLAVNNKLPGNNPVTGWGKGGVTGGSVGGGSSSPEAESEDESKDTESTASAKVDTPDIKAAFVAKEPATTPAPSPVAPADNGASPAQEGGPEVEVVVETVWTSKTVFAEPTPVAKREAHAHRHMGRHARRSNRN